MIKVMDFWLDLGVDGFRVDAVPYLFEREGTSCENLPETHAYLKELRSFVDKNYPGRILLCEANQWPRDVRSYFGNGNEFQMAFHFPLMPRIFMALRQADRSPIVWALEHTPPIPDNCQWCTFLRNHDELTLEMVTEEERQWMWQEYARDPRMRLNLGIRRRLAPLLDNDRRKIELANSLLFTLPGSPIVYYGDEIGMGDDIWLSDRNGVRTPMQWDSSNCAGFSLNKIPYSQVIKDDLYAYTHINVSFQRTDPFSLWHTLRKMIAIRKLHLALSCGDMSWIDCGNRAIAAYLQYCEGEKLLVINNLSGSSQLKKCSLPSPCHLTDLLTKEQYNAPEDSLSLSLLPYQYLWLRIEPKTSD